MNTKIKTILIVITTLILQLPYLIVLIVKEMF